MYLSFCFYGANTRRFLTYTTNFCFSLLGIYVLQVCSFRFVFTALMRVVFYFTLTDLSSSTWYLTPLQPEIQVHIAFVLFLCANTRRIFTLHFTIFFFLQYGALYVSYFFFTLTNLFLFLLGICARYSHRRFVDRILTKSLIFLRLISILQKSKRNWLKCAPLWTG